MSRTSLLWFGRTRNMPTKHDTIFGASGRARLPHQSPLLGSSLTGRHDSVDMNRSQNRTPTHARTHESITHFESARLAARGVSREHNSRMTSKHDSLRSVRRTCHKCTLHQPLSRFSFDKTCVHTGTYIYIETYYEKQ